MKKQPEEKVTEMPKQANSFKNLPHDVWTPRKGMKAGDRFSAAGYNCKVERIVDAANSEYDLCKVSVTDKISDYNPLRVGGVVWGQA